MQANHKWWPWSISLVILYSKHTHFSFFLNTISTLHIWFLHVVVISKCFNLYKVRFCIYLPYFIPVTLSFLFDCFYRLSHRLFNLGQLAYFTQNIQQQNSDSQIPAILFSYFIFVIVVVVVVVAITKPLKC